MRVVLDTNVLMSAFGSRGLCEAVLSICLERHEIVLSESILSELSEKLTDKFDMPVRRINPILSFLRERTIQVDPSELPLTSCRDPDDVMVLGTAVAGQADVIVTGDKDLLELKKFKEIPILTPRRFYEKFH